MNREEIYTKEKKIGKINSITNKKTKDFRNTYFLKSAKIGLLFSLSAHSQATEMFQLRYTILSDYPQAESFCYIPSLRKAEFIIPTDIHFFDKKSFNFYGGIKHSIKERLTKYNFDILICFNITTNKPFEKLVNAFTANLKTGIAFTGSENLYEISIGNPHKPLDYETFYYQLLFYLKQLQINFLKHKN